MENIYKWDGIERRKTMDSEIQDLKIEVATLSERVSNWMDTTTEYRRSTCEKLSLIQDKVSNLPCREGMAMKKNLGFQIKLLWGFVTAILLAIVAEYIKIK